MQRLFSLLLLSFLLAGCASAPTTANRSGRHPSDGWIRGTMTCLEDGTVYSFRIQKKFAFGGSASGGVVALHPDGRTRLAGQYTGALNAFGSFQTDTASATRTTADGKETQSAKTESWQLRTANAQAVLAGAGRTIQLRLLIHAGLMPHGTGEGRGNDGKHYAIQF